MPRPERPRPELQIGDGTLPVLVSAVLLAGGIAAAVAAATLRFAPAEAPRIASVRLGEMTAAYATRAAKDGEAGEAVRAWGAALEAALDEVALRRGAVLLPARAVAAGAPDATEEVEAAMARLLGTAQGDARGDAPGDARGTRR